MRRFKHATYAAAACVALALPAAAAAKVIGDRRRAARRDPGLPRQALPRVTRTTGYQAKVGTKRGLTTIPRDGRIVAWTITLGKPGKKQIKFFDDNLGGAAPGAASPSCARGQACATASSARASPQKLQPYFGTTVQFPLDRAIPVKKGYVVALTVADVGPGARGRPARRHVLARLARQGHVRRDLEADRADAARHLAQYYCLYRGARLTYSATFVPDPVRRRRP